MSLELLYLLSIFIPFAFPIILFSTIGQVDIGQTYNQSLRLIDIISLTVFNLMVLCILNKDYYSGQSVVHRLVGLQIVDNKTLVPANSMKCMLRNITMPIWPLEGLFVLINPKRRLGDFIAGTKIIDTFESDPELILIEISKTKFNRLTILTLTGSVLVSIIYLIIFDDRLRFW
jgi:uncharacterized RDD family membrane protein YckC